MNEKRAKLIRKKFKAADKLSATEYYHRNAKGTITRNDSTRKEFQRINNIFKNKPIGDNL